MSHLFANYSLLGSELIAYDAHNKIVLREPIKNFPGYDNPEEFCNHIDTLIASKGDTGYAAYLHLHRRRETRYAHFLGVAMFVLFITSGHPYLAVGFFLAHSIGSHIFLEENTPATARSPLRAVQYLWYELRMIYDGFRKVLSKKKP